MQFSYWSTSSFTRLFVQKIDRCPDTFAGGYIKCAHFDFSITKNHTCLNLTSWTILWYCRSIHRISILEHIQNQCSFKKIEYSQEMMQQFLYRFSSRQDRLHRSVYLIPNSRTKWYELFGRFAEWKIWRRGRPSCSGEPNASFFICMWSL